MDVQGPEVAAPYVKKAGVEYPVVVDRANLVAGELLGQKVIPLAALIDELGVLRFSRAGGPPAVRDEILAILEEESVAPPPAVATASPADLRKRVTAAPDNLKLRLDLAGTLSARGEYAEARKELQAAAKLAPKSWLPRFRLGMLSLAEKKPDEATKELREALALDPENYLIRKQIWAVENPDKFYTGRVDYGWQQRQLRRERRGG